MKKYTIGFLSVAGVFAFVAIAAAPASAATNTAANTGRINICNKQVEQLAKVSTDLEFFKGTHYLEPSAADIAAHYKSVVKKGSSVPVPTAIYKGDGPKSRVGKTNYFLVEKRFRDTQTYFSSIVLKTRATPTSLPTPALNLENLDQFIVDNLALKAAINGQIAAIDKVKADFPVATYDCVTGKDRSAVAKKYVAEKAAVKKLKADVKAIVYTKSKASRADYQKLEKQRATLARQNKI